MIPLYLRPLDRVIIVPSMYTSLLFSPRWGEIRANIWSGDSNIDLIVADTMDLNLLQYAAMHADILLLKEAVKLGAALDYPNTQWEMLPSGTTALHIAC